MNKVGEDFMESVWMCVKLGVIFKNWVLVL